MPPTQAQTHCQFLCLLRNPTFAWKQPELFGQQMRTHLNTNGWPFPRIGFAADTYKSSLPESCPPVPAARRPLLPADTFPRLLFSAENKCPRGLHRPAAAVTGGRQLRRQRRRSLQYQQNFAVEIIEVECNRGIFSIAICNVLQFATSQTTSKYVKKCL